ncbi:MAG: MucB/RseB C-terminal domain-containing protein [Pseudomonadota bacterium]|nr:MucB/RseB C-terminal domain-containing protein [Pseudomonadota bacterium]
MPPALQPPYRRWRSRSGAIAWSLPALLFSLSLSAFGASAAPAQAASNAAAADPPDARAWLARIHHAANRGNYEGTLVFSAGGTMSSSRVAHYAIGDQTYERLEALDGRQRRIVRHNNVVHTLWPQSHTAVVEQRDALAAWSATPQTVDPVALEQYSLHPEGSARIAGREARVALLQPRDNLRYAQRLWADRETGLMLRADVLAPPGPQANPTRPAQVLESTAFSEVLIGVKPRPEGLLRSLHEVDASARAASTAQADTHINAARGWQVVKPLQSSTTLAAEGWAVEHPVPGFSLSGCVRRSMHAAAAEAPVLQAVFTDGLTHVSVFMEAYNPARHGQALRGQHGATGSAMMRRGDDWITVVGDVPMSTLLLFSEALARQPR